jgi:hypothetical protein
MTKKWHLGCLSLLYSVFSIGASAGYADVRTTCHLNTSSLVGHRAGPFSIAFQLKDSSVIGDSNNTITLTNFQFGGGRPTGSPTAMGGVTGDLSSAVRLIDSAFLNYFLQQFVPGSELSFTLTSTANVDTGQLADQFSFSILDNTGAEIPTLTGIAFLDAFAILELNSSTPSLQTFASDPNRAPAGGGNPIASTTTSAIFAQVAIGGSDASGGTYTTIFTLLNTGSDTLNGNLILTDQNGKPLNANLSSDQNSVVGSSIPVSLKPGQTTFITARTPNPSDTTLYVGWGRVDCAGGALSGVATFELTLSGALKTIVGVLSSSLVSVATIPIDDDVSNSRSTGYAVANPGSSSITVSVREVSADTNTVTALTDIQLGPGQQKAAFFFEDPKASQNQKLKGSAVLIGRNGESFAIVAIVLNQNLLTAIPVVPAKAANIN